MHSDVKIESDSESFEGVQMTSSGSEEVAGLDLFGAGDDSSLIVLAPFTDLAVAESELAKTTDKALRYFLQWFKNRPILEFFFNIITTINLNYNKLLGGYSNNT